jgi:hypothetical protein
MLQFDEKSHVYTVNNEPCVSVTTLVNSCFRTFVADDVLAHMKNRIKYPGMTNDEIKAKWELDANTARTMGTQMHATIERYYKNEPLEDEVHTLEIKNFMKFASTHVLIPYNVEWRVCNEDVHLAGTLDFASSNSDGTIDIYDWKCCKDLGFVAYNAYSHVIPHIPDTKYWKYTVQLNLYKFLVESKYNKRVRKMVLVCFHPSKPYYKLEVADIQAYIPDILGQIQLKQVNE